ncbi:MAG TPA: IclR family transcriptional regulator [Candidatus Acidoferrales bacterium]|nr:IclR family transcriptional regulator [Candidatus Acidoferrales bacterium]
MPNDLLGSVRRALRVLDYIAEAGGSAAPREIAAATGSNISTVYHVLNTLATDGYAERDDGTGRYRLGRKVAPLGNAFIRSLPVAPNLYPVVRRLAEAAGDDAYLAILAGGHVVIAEIVETSKHPRVYPGYTAHLHARAIGKAVLAYCDADFVRAHFEDSPPQRLTARTLTTLPAIEAELARVRAQGYAEDIEEFADGVCCIAAPVFDGRGAVYGAIAVSIPALRYRSSSATAHDAVIAAAGAATAALTDEVRRFAAGTRTS